MNGTIPTVTNITNSALSTIKGRNFTVEGTVLDYQGHKVPDMLVRIYLALGKEGNRSLCGIGEAIKGSFNVTCLIPQNLAPGDYQLIARSISNFVFQGSSSDPVIRVMDGTSIVFTGAQKVVEGVVSLIQVALVYNSTGEVVSGAKLSATGYKEIGLVSGVYAMDRLVISTGQAGNYSVHIAYAGNDHLLSSSGDFVLHAAKVTVDVDHDDLVRGRDNIVACRMHAEEIPIGNTLIFVTLADGVVISDLYTSGNGMFALSAPMPSDHPLQNMSVTYRLFNGPFYESSYRVTAATEIQSKVAEDRIELRLVEDSGAPLADKPILVEGPEGIRNYSTDESGQVVLSVGRGTESNYTVSFSGEAFLQPASALVHHPASYVMPLNYVAVFFLAGIMAASGYYYYRKRPNVRELIASILPARPAAPKGPYKVRFPDIPEGLPAVWSQSPLLVELEGKARELQLWVDDVPLQTLTLEHGRARAPVLLGKGTHRLSARGSQGISECEVRIVDYREEVVGLYKHTFVRLMSSTPGLSPDMTPREAQRMLEGRIGIDRYGDLETMTSLFERANFSLAPVGRREYESMFLSTSRVSA
jgi:hypothetical protein